MASYFSNNYSTDKIQGRITDGSLPYLHQCRSDLPVIGYITIPTRPQAQSTYLQMSYTYDRLTPPGVLAST